MLRLGEKQKWARLQEADNHRCFLKAEGFYTEKIRLEIILLILLRGFIWLPAEVLILTSAVLHINNLPTVGELPLSYLAMRGWFCLSFLFDRTRWETCPSKISVMKTKYFWALTTELYFVQTLLSRAFISWCRWTYVESVDFRIRPVDELLWEVAPFHHQHVHLHTFKGTNRGATFTVHQTFKDSRPSELNSVLLVMLKKILHSFFFRTF